MFDKASRSGQLGEVQRSVARVDDAPKSKNPPLTIIPTAETRPGAWPQAMLSSAFGQKIGKDEPLAKNCLGTAHDRFLIAR